MSDRSELITFPSDFPIKIVGNATPTFEQEILDIARVHHPELTEDAVQLKKSGQGNYLAITVTVHAVSQAALDALYTDLSQHPDTKMVL